MKIKKISLNDMKGKQTKEEKKALCLLKDWHKGAEKKKDFGGVLERGDNL
ncbi:hypothetical protein HYT26_04895 [Candidatus Pacearchaeota archaeon]|nr:hypothetical protein [Candidatus Pacearchaeota archaeon]